MTLEDRLKQIALSEENEKKIVGEKTMATVIGQLLQLSKVGQVFQTVITWNKEVAKEISSAKEVILLEEYLNKTDSHETALRSLMNLVGDPQGNTLFNKILRILDDWPPDYELVKQLASALKFISEQGNFATLFEKHKFTLSQIERLSPQSLAIMYDSLNFPDFRIGTFSAIGGKITSEWQVEFTKIYCKMKEIDGDDKINRVLHCVVELTRQGYIAALNIEGHGAKCVLTDVGRDLIPYIS